MGVVFVFNIFHPGLWLQRYLIIASPAVFLALAAGLSRVLRLRMVVVALVFLTLGSATVLENASAGNPLEENFRDAAAVVTHSYQPGDVVLMVPYFNATPFRYYFSPDTAVWGYDRSAFAITHKLLPKLARKHVGSSMWTVIDTFTLKEDPTQRTLGDLAKRRVLVVGAGETAELTARALAARGVEAVFIANRRYDRAIGLAENPAGLPEGVEDAADTRHDVVDPELEIFRAIANGGQRWIFWRVSIRLSDARRSPRPGRGSFWPGRAQERLARLLPASRSLLSTTG